MSKKTIIIIVAVIAAVVLWAVSSYNGLVQKEETVKSSWSDVENVYQRRADLIPNLVATVKGYAAHERGTLEEVVEARAKASATTVNVQDEQSIAAFQKVQGELSSALSRLMVVVERYPDLKANENFKDLQAQLEGTENRITQARKVYNETARGYNTQIRRFPDNIIAGMFGFASKGYFEADQAAATAPKVEF